MASKDSLIAGGELIEAISDNLLLKDNDLLKDIPLLGSIIGGVNFYTSLKTKIFERKIHAFLYEFKPEELENFKKLISKKGTEDLGFEILSVIDNVDKINQVQMIARATKLYIAALEEGKNPRNIFDHHIHVIKQLDEYLLAGLHAIYGQETSIRLSQVDQALFNLGLLDQKMEPALAGAESHPKLSFSDSLAGHHFYKTIVIGKEES